MGQFCASFRGYLAPEYAMRGQLTRKADIYSFGVLLLEIVSGRPNQNRWLPVEEQYLLERVWQQYKEGELESLVDTSVEDVDMYEACQYLKIGLLCSQSLPKSRPSMSNVIKMLNDEIDLSEKDLSDPGLLSELMDYKTGKNNTSGTMSSGSGSHDYSRLTYGNTTSVPNMTFTTITER